MKHIHHSFKTITFQKRQLATHLYQTTTIVSIKVKI